MLRAEFCLPSITAEEGAPERKAPIRVKFEIPYFTVSGIQVCINRHPFFCDIKILLVHFCQYTMIHIDRYFNFISLMSSGVYVNEQGGIFFHGSDG